MTTAAKATYQAALGTDHNYVHMIAAGRDNLARLVLNLKTGEPGTHGYFSTGGQVSRQFSVLDLPAHTKLKYRQSGQSSQADLEARDLRTEMENKEKSAHISKLHEKDKNAATIAEEELKRSRDAAQPLLLKDKAEITKLTRQFDDRDDEADDDGGESDLDSSEDEDDDDEEMLRRELEKIKKEREEARRKKEQEEKAEVARKREEEVNAAALKGNPLLASATSGSAQMKRKWNDDVVFKNQARGEVDKKKRFVNDTIRNDFHKQFLKKYMK